MLDYDRFSPTWDIDVKLHNLSRYLQGVGGTSTSVGGNVEAENLGLYKLRRAPLFDGTLPDRPLRSAVEGARTEYLGEYAACSA